MDVVRTAWCAWMVSLAAAGAWAADADPQTGTGGVTLYRMGSLTEHGSKFHVLVDGKEVGRLADSSALHLRASPGVHRVTVSPGGVAQERSSAIRFEPGVEKFVQYTFVTGPLYNRYFVGSDIEPRTMEKAQEDMKAAEIAQPQEVAVGTAPAFATVENADAVPVNAAGRQAYRDWLKLPKPRVFLIASESVWETASGQQPNSRWPDPLQRALDNCRYRRAGPCKLYAFDDFVVWGESADAN